MENLNLAITSFNAINNSQGKQILNDQYTTTFNPVKIDVLFSTIVETNETFQKFPFPQWLVSKYTGSLNNFTAHFTSLMNATHTNNVINFTLIQEWLKANWMLDHDQPGKFYEVYMTFTSLFSKAVSAELSAQIERNDQLHTELVKKTSEKLAIDYIKAYDKEADRNQTASVIWLCVAAGICVVFGLVMWWLYSIYPTPNDKNKAFYGSLLTNYIVTKAVVLSVLIFVLSWALKQYRIHRHLFTVSNNKAVALGSFTSFILTIDDKASRESISIEIAKIIYDPGHSGYLGEKDSDFPSIINNLGVK